MIELVVQQIAEKLANTVIDAGGRGLQRRLGRAILGTPEERAVRDVYSRAIAGMLLGEMRHATGAGEDADAYGEQLKVAETLLGELFADEEAADVLLEAALKWGPVPVDVLRDRFVELDRDPDTLLPFGFDRAMIILTDRLYDEFVLEARKENSRIQPLVNEELLSASREHHAVLRELMLRKPRLGVTGKEALLESKARCAVRWRALGINQEVAVALATDPEVGAPPPDLSEQLESTEGGVSILTAEIGVGKSLMLERIHQRALYRFNESSGTPVPVFLRARNVDGSLRGAVMTKARPMGDTSSRGCLLCLDGVEEVGYSRALELLEEARELIYVWPGTTVMITSRPLSGFGFEEELVPVQPLSEEEAEELAGRFSSDATPFAFPHDWPESLRNAVRRPLFSILVGLDWAERCGAGIARAPWGNFWRGS